MGGNESALAPLVDINHACIGLLCARAAQDEAPPLLARFARQWLELTPGACRRLASVPWLLVEPVIPAAGEPRPRSRTEAPSYFGPEALPVMRHVLVFCWHLARSQPQLARLALGLRAEQCARLLERPLAGLDELAERTLSAVRPRWETSLPVWRQLLWAAAEEDRKRIVKAGHQGLQLLAARCLVMTDGDARV